MKRKKAARRRLTYSRHEGSEPLVWMRQTGPQRFEIKIAPSFCGPVGIVPDEYKQLFVTQSKEMIERLQREIAAPEQEEGFNLFPADLIADLKNVNVPCDGWELFRKLFERGCIYGFITGVFMVHMPENTAIRTALNRGRKKGADTVRQKAAPKKMAVRKRFRELRKSGFTKTAARQLIEQETDISFRQIERDTAGLS